MSISIDLKRGIYQGTCCKIRVRAENGLVILFIDHSKIEFNTPTAFRVGFSIVKKAGLALQGEFVSWVINGKEIQLLPEQALKVGGAILRKTDDADDFQIGKRIIQ